MTPVALRTTIERTLPGLERLYLAGQWVMPGGGVPTVLYSGRHAVQILCDRDGKHLRRVSFDQVHTNYPTVTDDDLPF